MERVFDRVELENLPDVAGDILKLFPDNRFFVVNGEMGAGKTTLIRQLCKAIGVDGFTTSPTFALINEYFSPAKGPVYHFDFYRINKLTEVYDIGYEEYFYSDNYCFIEWSEKIRELLPDKYVEVNIETGDGFRRLSVRLSGN